MAHIDQDILPCQPRRLSVRQFTATDWADIISALEVAGQTTFVGVSIHISAKGYVDAVAFAIAEEILYVALEPSCGDVRAEELDAFPLTKPISLPLVGFAMERIALRLYCDHRLFLHGIDLATLPFNARRSPSNFIHTRVDGQVRVAPIYKLWRTTSEVDVVKNTCLRAWVSSVCASTSLKELKAIPSLGTANMTHAALICLGKMSYLVERLQEHQSTRIQSEFEAVQKHVRSKYIDLMNTRFKTRLHQDRNRPIVLKTMLGNTLIGRSVEGDGRRTKIRIIRGTYHDEGLKEILICGHEEGKLSDHARDDFVRHLLQGTAKLEDSFFIGRIWFPQSQTVLPRSPHRSSQPEPTFPELNTSQRLVAAAMISAPDPLVITHGPPGTGKTFTIATVVKHWLTNCADNLVFIVAQTNVGVKNIARALHNIGIVNFTLIVSDDFYVDWHEHLYEGMHSNIMRSSKMDRNFTKKRFSRGCQVVLCTLNMLSHPVLKRRLDTLPVHKLVMDEASQVHIAEYMHVLHRLKYLQKLCFFGDPNQLPPQGHDVIPELQSIFDVAHLKSSAYFLDTQYRMPVPLGDFLSQEVYNSQLQSVHPITSTSCVTFIDVANGREQRQGTSWINTAEVNVIVALLQDYYNRSGVCVITPYDAQRAEIQKALEQANLPNDIVFNVDSFQGHAAKYVIVSTVRTKGTGFLSVRNRTTVMLSRCQAGMVIVSNRTFVRGAGKDTLLGKLAGYWDEKGADTWVSCEQVLEGTAQLPGFAGAVVCPMIGPPAEREA